MQPVFIVTIDTEGDNLWGKPREIATKNARTLPRFQQLCERHGLKPTYLTNYEMALDDAFVEFARDAQRRGVAEIGMHLHAWNSPPITPLTSDDFRYQPFLCEYPEDQIRAKVRFMTELLTEKFGAPVSHRAGRWAMSPTYARALVENGYRVDCSVTPGVSWVDTLGDPNGAGGTDYTFFPDRPYFMNLDDLARPGRSSLLQVPMTVRTRQREVLPYLPKALTQTTLARRILNRFTPIRWMRPRGRNLPDLLRLVDEGHRGGWEYLQFTLHSSELMAGGSPNYTSDRDIDLLYEDLEVLFAALRGKFWGATIAEYDQHYRSTH